MSKLYDCLYAHPSSSQCSCEPCRATYLKPRKMAWSDIVPLGYFATWGGEPNSSIEELNKLLGESRRLLNSRTGIA